MNSWQGDFGCHFFAVIRSLERNSSASLSISEGEDGDSHSTGVCWAVAELCGAAVLGVGILGINGGMGRSCGAPLHSGTRKGRLASGPIDAAAALSDSRCLTPVLSESLTDGYVALMLTSNGGATTNWGWVELQYDINAGNVTIVQAGYNATAGESLVTPPIGPVPEPATVALFGLGGTLLALRLRSRTK